MNRQLARLGTVLWPPGMDVDINTSYLERRLDPLRHKYTSAHSVSAGTLLPGLGPNEL